jgi:hypothetical protein
MALQVQKRGFHIPRTIGRVATLEKQDFPFNGGDVKFAWAAIAGFNVWFVDQERPFNSLRVDANAVEWHGNTAQVTINFCLRDFSGDIDDTYEGFLDVLVIADVG